MTPELNSVSEMCAYNRAVHVSVASPFCFKVRIPIKNVCQHWTLTELEGGRSRVDGSFSLDLVFSFNETLARVEIHP